MPEYDFLNLSPPEFEDLAKDLLQKKFNVVLETFTSGRDSGIDIRYIGDHKNILIIQCKRYRDYSSLLSSLKKELKKVQLLNPNRYILCTSVGLTPENKKDIADLFSPYIENESDILGRNDLNNLITLYPSIEKNHFKLWLSSTNVLERILHSRIYNQSSFEEDKIKETIKVYVKNQSLANALTILKEHKYVIISGLPGIGKTTLARILVYHFLANDFEEFVFISDSIKEGYTAYKEGVRQIFLFDDFLGRNFLEKKLSNNEEHRIIKFIEKINSSKNKVLILTTREYILSQAKQQYDIFDNPTLEFAKCIIDLSQYTRIVRARILYNHLYFSNISDDYLKNIIDSGSYIGIINHSNYNPRIIETITNNYVWKNIEPENFSGKILSFLNYPESIWKHVYVNQISRLSQCLLATLMTAGTPIFLDDLFDLIKGFANSNSHNYGIYFTEIDFYKSIKELENTFIISKRDGNSKLSVEYKNPSVLDFLVNYFQNSNAFLVDIINSAIFFNQLFSIFIIEGSPSSLSHAKNQKRKITLKGDSKTTFIKKLVDSYDHFKVSSLTSSWIINPFISEDWVYVYERASYSDYYKLNIILKETPTREFPELREFLLRKFDTIKEPPFLKRGEVSLYLSILSEFHEELELDTKSIIEICFDAISDLDGFDVFTKLEDMFPIEFADFSESQEFTDKAYEILVDEAKIADLEDIENIRDNIRIVSRKFHLDFDEASKIIEKRIKENETQEEDYDYPDVPTEEDETSKISLPDENQLIKSMFESLIETKAELNI